MVCIGIRKKRIEISFLFFFIIAILSSCGLDTFYVIMPPVHYDHKPAITNSDALDNYVEFRTNENQPQLPSDFYFAGTTVYYRIYSDTNTVENFNNLIESVNTSSNYNAAADKLLAAGYQILQYRADGATSNSGLTIEPIGSSQVVKIRLSDYNEITDTPNAEYQDQIEINGFRIGRPRRVSENNLTFNFGRCERSGYETTCKRPVPNDSDYEGNSTSEEWYYINLYAMASGHDTTFKTYYSNVLHLGCLKVKVPSDTNW